MSSFSLFGRGLMRAMAVFVLVLAVGACAQNRAGQDMAGGAGGNVAPGSQQDFVVNVGDRVFFETDRTTLTPQARETLNRQAQWLRQYPQYAVTIEGHADERGTREYNLGLSARRAEVVRDYIVSQGIQGSRLRTVSYGKERPVQVCNDESCWSQNRRAVTVVNAGPTS
jgi:peptidoglycan-associated lipoprotein